MNSPFPTPTFLRVYYTRPVTGACGCCGIVSRMRVLDLDRQRPVCRDCVSASIQAAEALRAAGLVPPNGRLIERNP